MSQRPDLNDPHQLAHQLRTHSAEVTDRHVTEELMRMADRVDGGTGPAAHHGCPDVSVPTAACTECAMVLEAEVGGGGREPSIFAAADFVERYDADFGD